jgi:ATP adenylyltransferase
LDRLWSPWRNEYVASAGGKLASGCLFCALHADASQDELNFVVHRAKNNYVVLNRYPYTCGHVLIAPYAHTADLDQASKETTDELMDLIKRCQGVLRDVYQPEGFNVGINLGKAAGAGVAEHLHIHVLPRWNGDTNFMTSVGDVRVLPESLESTYAKLQARFSSDQP